MDFETFEGQQDETKLRIFKKGNYEYILKVVEPFNMWQVRMTNGNCPAGLDGVFTSIEAAEKAIEGYINRTSMLLERNKPKEKRQVNTNPDATSNIKSVKVKKK